MAATNWILSEYPKQKRKKTLQRHCVIRTSVGPQRWQCTVCDLAFRRKPYAPTCKGRRHGSITMTDANATIKRRPIGVGR